MTGSVSKSDFGKNNKLNGDFKRLPEFYGSVVALVGSQWGDEGKGKLIDIMAEHYDIVARGSGGANAGHTVYIADPDQPEKNKKFIFRLMPSGMLHPHVTGVLGNGCVIHIPTLLEEIEALNQNGINLENRLLISDRAHLVLEYHKILDKLQEEAKGDQKVGTTGKGIGPCYTDKIARQGLRIQDLLDMDSFERKVRERFKPLENTFKNHGIEYDLKAELENYRRILPLIRNMIVDTSLWLNKAIVEGKKILLEGANGTLLDVDHGTYPYVTSSNASIGGLISGSGVSPLQLKSSIGIMKAYCTRVGSGPFPTELDNELGEQIRTIGNEFGSVTGRPRRCGWFDAVAAQYSCRINGFSALNLTKLDVLDNLESLKIAVGYSLNGQRLEGFPASIEALEQLEVEYIEMPGWKTSTAGARKISELPEAAQNYIHKIEELTGCPIHFVGVGVRRDELALAD